MEDRMVSWEDKFTSCFYSWNPENAEWVNQPLSSSDQSIYLNAHLLESQVEKRESQVEKRVPCFEKEILTLFFSSEGGIKN